MVCNPVSPSTIMLSDGLAGNACILHMRVAFAALVPPSKLVVSLSPVPLIWGAFSTVGA
jgi:hypothetical protein